MGMARRACSLDERNLLGERCGGSPLLDHDLVDWRHVVIWNH
jgi:hypothetical protein